MTRRRALYSAGAALFLLILVLGFLAGTSEQHRLDRAERNQTVVHRNLRATRWQTQSENVVLRTDLATAVQLTKDIDAATADTTAVQTELGTAHAALDNARLVLASQGLRRTNVTKCLDGIARALTATHAGDTPAATAFLRGAAPACLSAMAAPGAGAPVMPYDFADPYVLHVGSTYYAYATNAVGGAVQQARSTDLVHWDLTGNVLANVPPWAVKGTIWAPAALQRGGTTVLYYTVRDAATSRQCISTALGTRPEGPFLDGSAAPLECGEKGAIDPSPFVDGTGDAYLLYKTESPARIWTRRLTPDGLGFSGPPQQLLAPSQKWEGGNVEAPSMLRAGLTYWLFYSGNDWNGASYAEGLARCQGPTGPCTPIKTNPVLASAGSNAGPGGGEVFTDAAGGWWIAYHAYQEPLVKYPNSRLLRLGRITFDAGGQPVVTP